MRFVLQTAKRELRSSWRRLLFFFLCIGVGVGSIVALRSVIRNINRAVTSEARLLLTADVQIDSERPWKPETLAVIDRIAKEPMVLGKVETIEAATMIRPADPEREGAMMVELKGIEPPFPLFGDFKMSDGMPFNYSLIKNNGAVVASALLERLNVKVGDEVKIGDSNFQIRGTIEKEPGGGSGFRLGPRVFIERSSVEGTGLVGFGSRARRKILLRTDEDRMEFAVKRLREELKGNLVNVRTYKESQQNLSDQFSRAEDFLSLTGLVILVLGGIGVSNVTRVFIDQKKRSIAVLKCIGATGKRIIAAYLSQIIALGIAGSLLGVVLAKIALKALARFYAESLPPNMSYDLQNGAIAQGIGIGLLISILFSAVPLLAIRRIKPNLLLRDAVESGKRIFDPLTWLTGAAAVAGLTALASWQAGSFRVGVSFLAGLAAAAGALHLAAALLIALVRKAKRIRSFALRQAINSLYRPGNQTRVIVMAVGLGVFLVISVWSIQTNLVREFDLGRRGKLPDMFLIDIQKDQEAGMKELIEKATGERPLLIPTIRARIVAINGQSFDLDSAELKRKRGMLGREYTITYRANLESNETVVEGNFWDGSPSAEPEISFEESMRGLLGLDVGGTITFDIQGRKLTARATSIRRVDWRNSRTGFMVLFRPGTLENAPQMMVGAINAPMEGKERVQFQRSILDRFPNVSIVDVSEIVQIAKRIINNVTLAVSFVGGFVLLSGMLILAGSIAMTKFQRIYEAAVLKTLGAKRRVLLAILLAEYGLLGLVAGSIGAAAGAGLSYAASRWIFDIEWSFAPELAFGAAAGAVLLVVAVGAASSANALSQKPLAILRAQ